MQESEMNKNNKKKKKKKKKNRSVNDVINPLRMTIFVMKVAT